MTSPSLLEHIRCLGEAFGVEGRPTSRQPGTLLGKLCQAYRTGDLPFEILAVHLDGCNRPAVETWENLRRVPLGSGGRRRHPGPGPSDGGPGLARRRS